MVSAARPADDAHASTPPSTSSPADPTPARGRAGAGKPPSDRRAAANRANARKSTGPRTAAGRARSRMNALKHGLCARVVLLPGEDWREYQAFEQAFADDLKPLGVIQEMLAGRAAALAWALQRLPDAASDLAERGERRRFGRWFDGRGLGEKFERLRLRDERLGVPPASRDVLDEVFGAELAIARSQGNPAPDDRDAAGIVADALAGDDAFAAVLKLEEHERRLWSALLSVLRALERRQKIDGKAEGGDGGDARDRNEAAHPPERAEDDGPQQGVTDMERAPAAPPAAPDEPTTVPPVATNQTSARPGDPETERAVEGDDGTPDESGASARPDPSRGSAALRDSTTRLSSSKSELAEVRGVAQWSEQQRAPARNEANVEEGLRVGTDEGPDDGGAEARSDDPPPG